MTIRTQLRFGPSQVTARMKYPEIRTKQNFTLVEKEESDERVLYKCMF